MSIVRFEKDGPLGRIILDDAPFNWVSDAYRNGLRQAVHDAGEADIRALLIHATGPNFSSGGAVHEWVGHSPLWLGTFLEEIKQSYRAIEAMRFPVIAAVRGTATGGGLELALACDFIVASETAVFWSLEILAGIIPVAGAVQRLVNLVGRAKAMRIVMLGEKTPITAVPEAADYIVADDKFDQFALDFATRLANGPTQAYAAIKAVLRAYSSGGVAAADALTADLTAPLFKTNDVQQGMVGIVPVYMQISAPGAVLPSGGFDLPRMNFSGN